MIIGFSRKFTPISGWQIAFSRTLTADSTGWNGFNLRQTFAASLLAFSGSQVRITFQASSAAGGISCDHVSCGHKATSPTHAWDFDGTEQPLLFSASASMSIAQGNTLVSDALTYTFDKTKDFIVAAHFNAASAIRNTNPVTGAVGYNKSGASETATDAPASYATNASALSFVTKIEVFV